MFDRAQECKYAGSLQPVAIILIHTPFRNIGKIYRGGTVLFDFSRRAFRVVRLSQMLEGVPPRHSRRLV